MTKLTLDMNTFKALASDTRLDILRALDGKNLSLNDICKATNLNKATLHEHLIKLNEAGLVKKKEREGHKWVYYKLTWKGEGLLHPENTRIVVMFSSTFISLLIAVILIVNFLQPIPIALAETVNDTTYLYEVESPGIPSFERSYSFNYIGEIDAREKTVGNITTELQTMSSIKNSIGSKFDDQEIIWFNAHIGSEPAVDFNFDMCYESSQQASKSIKYSDINQNYEPLENQQVLLYNKMYSMNLSANKAESTNNTYENETNEYSDGFERDYNETNVSMLGSEYDFGFLGFYPAVPKMIAIVQDTTLLYLAVACLMFFGTLFTISLWRLKVNKKPKL